jgi:DNA recombination protein RmuC
MTEILLAVIALLLAVLVLLDFLMKKSAENKLTDSQGAPLDFEKYFSKAENTFKDEFARNRNEASVNAKNIREELSNSLKNFFDTFSNQFKALSETMESKLKSIQDDNNEKLEKMRATVDEKLHATLEQRLGESFKIVSDRLELVHKGLGEMQSLATGVGDLKKVLSNVKTRGILGEFQLENILEQILTPGQYGKNIATKQGSSDTVEFAIKLPGRSNSDEVLWLPLDSKFPLESYHSLIDAYEQANPAAIDEATANLERTIKKCAKDIKEKYIDPPNTTDFAVMFLPIEG